MIKLYNIPVSGNCHKVRLMLNFLRLPYKTYDLDLSNNEQKQTDYLTLNPFGQAPVLDDSGLIIRDSQAILVYLASKYGGSRWWPEDVNELAQINAWLSTAANEITWGPSRIRAHYKFGRRIDMQQALDTTNNVLEIINKHLSNKTWLVGGKFSIADIAIYPYLALAHEGELDISPYQHIVSWISRIEAVQDYISMPGILNCTSR